MSNHSNRYLTLESEDQRPRSVLWTLEPDARLKMAEEQPVPRRVALLDEVILESPVTRGLEKACKRQVFLLLCLVATSVLAYLVHAGRIQF